MIPPPVKVQMQMCVQMQILTSVVMFYMTLHSVICGCGCGPVYFSHYCCCCCVKWSFSFGGPVHLLIRQWYIGLAIHLQLP